MQKREHKINDPKKPYKKDPLTKNTRKTHKKFTKKTTQKDNAKMFPQIDYTIKYT